MPTRLTRPQDRRRGAGAPDDYIPLSAATAIKPTNATGNIAVTISGFIVFPPMTLAPNTNSTPHNIEKFPMKDHAGIHGTPFGDAKRAVIQPRRRKQTVRLRENNTPVTPLAIHD